jgi:phosphate transport system permease protein
MFRQYYRIERKTKVPNSFKGDTIFYGVLRTVSISAVVIFLGIAGVLFVYSLPSIQKFGFGFLISSEWNPQDQIFGAFPYIVGTTITSVIALVVAIPFVIGFVVFREYAPKWLGEMMTFCVEILATIPSIAYGLCGVALLVPLMRVYVDPFLKNTLGTFPVIGQWFRGSTTGYNLFTGGTLLAVMIYPIMVSLTNELVAQVPKEHRRAFILAGATRWQSVRLGLFPYIKRSIAGPAILGLARAIGETVAVSMVIGNSSRQIQSLFTAGSTLSSVIANQFLDSDTTIYRSSITELGLILIIFSVSCFSLGRLLIHRAITKGVSS